MRREIRVSLMALLGALAVLIYFIAQNRAGSPDNSSQKLFKSSETSSTRLHQFKEFEELNQKAVKRSEELYS